MRRATVCGAGRVAGSLGAVAATLFLLAAAAPAAGDGTPAFTSVAIGTSADTSPRVSGDGTRVAYAHLTAIPHCECAQTDDYVWSASSQTGELVDTPDGVTPADNDGADLPSLSLDGNVAVFFSAASNLPGSTAPPNTLFGPGGIYIRDTAASTTARVDGGASLCGIWRIAEGDPRSCDVVDQNPTVDQIEPPVRVVSGTNVNHAGVPAISADGNVVAFVARDLNAHEGVLIADRAAGAITLVYSTSVTVESVSSPALSADGSKLMFTARGEAGTTTPRLIVYDVSTGAATTIFSQTEGVDFAGDDPQLSADGRTAAVGVLTSDGERVALVDTSTGAVSYGPDMPGDPFKSCSPGEPQWSMSGDGRHLVYQAIDCATAPPTLVGWDRLTGETTQVTTTRTSDPVLDVSGDAVAYDGPGGAALATRSSDGDTTAPDWATGSALTVKSIGATSATLSWTLATDDRGVDQYNLLVNGSSVARVGAATFSRQIDGLNPSTHYAFQIVAVDGAGNTADGPTTDATTTAGSGGLTTLTVSTAPGGLAHLGWSPSAAAPGGFRILRGSNGGPLNAVADVAAGVSAFTDEGLDASTTYDWQVLAIANDGSTTPYTNVQGAATPPLASPLPAWSVPRVSSTVALGSDVAITVHAEANRAVTATVHYADAGGAETAPVPLTARGGGTWTGSFHLAVGTTRFAGLDASVTDGAGHTATASALGLPIAVSGRLDVTFADPENALGAAQLTGFSSSLRVRQRDRRTIARHVRAAPGCGIRLRGEAPRRDRAHSGVGCLGRRGGGRSDHADAHADLRRRGRREGRRRERRSALGRHRQGERRGRRRRRGRIRRRRPDERPRRRAGRDLGRPDRNAPAARGPVGGHRHAGCARGCEPADTRDATAPDRHAHGSRREPGPNAGRRVPCERGRADERRPGLELRGRYGRDRPLFHPGGGRDGDPHGRRRRRSGPDADGHGRSRGPSRGRPRRRRPSVRRAPRVLHAVRGSPPAGAAADQLECPNPLQDDPDGRWTDLPRQRQRRADRRGEPG